MDGSLIGALALGFLLGLRHALDADHVAAVSTFVSRERSVLGSCLRGTFWGLGHTLALLSAGVAVVAFKIQVSAALERGLERVVALVLVALGGHVLIRTASALSLHRHEHSHGGAPHRHLHVHLGDSGEPGHRHPWRGAPQPLLMGLLHGLAGSGALVLLVLTTMPTPVAAAVYLLVFGVGSTAGMLLLSGLIGIPFARAAGRSRALSATLQTVVGAVSVLVGVTMLLS